MRRLIAAVLAAASIAAGCAGLTGGQFATSDELRGPWRPEPLAVDPSTIRAAEQVCRAPDSGGPGAMVAVGRLVAVDARGDSRLALVFAGGGADSSECDLRMDGAGTLSIVGRGSSSSAGPAEFIAPNEVLIVSSGGMSGGGSEWASVTGRTGAVVTAVAVVIPGGPTVTASHGGGWFRAWWPKGQGNFVVEGFDASGKKVGEARQ